MCFIFLPNIITCFCCRSSRSPVNIIADTPSKCLVESESRARQYRSFLTHSNAICFGIIFGVVRFLSQEIFISAAGFCGKSFVPNGFSEGLTLRNYKNVRNMVSKLKDEIKFPSCNTSVPRSEPHALRALRAPSLISHFSSSAGKPPANSMEELLRVSMDAIYRATRSGKAAPGIHPAIGVHAPRCTLRSYLSFCDRERHFLPEEILKRPTCASLFRAGCILGLLSGMKPID